VEGAFTVLIIPFSDSDDFERYGSCYYAPVSDAVNLRLLPNLLNHLEKHDATIDDDTLTPTATLSLERLGEI
jgi:hypothetical protein